MEQKRIHRLLKILALIQSGRALNAATLAQECGIVERSIYRDIDVLKSANVPISFDRGRGGYSIRADFFLPPVHLSLDEALALAALCQEVAEREQIPFLRSAWRALAKIESHLPPAIREEIAQINNHIVIRTAETNPPDGYMDVYERIRAAIASRSALECEYEPANAAATGDPFLFEPYALFFCVRAWYAIGRHSARKELRCLKLSRFTRLTPTRRHYTIPSSFTLEKYLGNSWRMIRGEPEEEVEIWFDADFAPTMSDTCWHPTQQIDFHDDGSATFRCVVAGFDEIVWWILSMGPHCIVRKPETLRQRVRALAEETTALYERVETDPEA